LGFQAPAAGSEGHDGPFIATPDALLTLIKTIVSPNIGLTLDLWHWHVGAGSLKQIKEVSPEQIVSVRIADVPADADLREITEEQRLVPGTTGVVPAAAVLRWLSEQGYRGPVTAYCHPAQFTGVTRTQAVEQAAQSLTHLMGFTEEHAESESNAATAGAQK
jgi:sugar phosphate isomerase/epimerase